MRILELGNYIIPAYAGMILAEQGHEVEKWINGKDPILDLNCGDQLWEWINYGKQIIRQDVREIISSGERFDVVIDNFRPSALFRFGIEPKALAADYGLRWISMRSEVTETSFDIIAQARSWMEYGPWMPFYVGDTAAGLWLAFKAVASTDTGHYILGHASVLQKLVEGELTLDRPGGPIPWDPPGEYEYSDGKAKVIYRGRQYIEPIRDTCWKKNNLFHKNGRVII